MARTLTHSITYPMPIGRAWAQIADVRYQEGKLLAAGAANPVVTIRSQSDGATQIVLERDNPVVGVPAAVRKIVGDTAHVIETVNWSAPRPEDGRRTADLVTEFVGTPISMEGTFELLASGQATSLTLNAEYRSHVPLVGGKLEETAMAETVKALESEQEYSAGYGG
ncbi:MAG: DUF2505 domain-containing protein [Candidatus Nanopelagicales bacterium]